MGIGEEYTTSCKSIQVWSFALTLYEAATGRLPWGAYASEAYIRSSLEKRKVPPLKGLDDWTEMKVRK